MEHKTKLLMYAPVLKNKATGKYMCILSDDSIDREEEIIGKDFLLKVGNDFDYVPALANHKNDVFMQVGEWVNKRIEKINGHNALVAEPKFYKSNPNSVIIKGMLDEGAKIGISIGAIPKDYKETSIDGKKYREYTDGELLEASFVAIPANSHARAMAVAKSLGTMTKPKNVEECVRGLMSDPNFKPQDGKTKEESAWAVCQSQHKSTDDSNKKSKEENTMEEDKLEDFQKTIDEKFAELEKKIEALTKSEEPEEKKKEPKEEPKEEKSEPEAEKKVNSELEKMKEELKAKDAEITNLKEKVKDSETKYKEIYEKKQKEAPKGIPVLR